LIVNNFVKAGELINMGSSARAMIFSARVTWWVGAPFWGPNSPMFEIYGKREKVYPYLGNGAS